MDIVGVGVGMFIEGEDAGMGMPPAMAMSWWTPCHQSYTSACGAPLTTASMLPESWVHTIISPLGLTKWQNIRPAACESGFSVPDIDWAIENFARWKNAWFQLISPSVSMSPQLPTLGLKGACETDWTSAW